MSVYTNVPWNNSNPPNSQAANTAASEYRKTKLDVQERLSSFFIDIDVDPLVPKDGSIPLSALVSSGGGTVALPGTRVQEHYLGGQPFDPVNQNYDISNVNYVTITWDGVGVTSTHWIHPLRIAKGVDIASVALRYKRDSGAAFTGTLYRATDDTIESLVTATSAATGWNTMTLTIAHTLAAAYTYYLKIDMSTNAGGSANARYQSMYVEVP